MTKALLFTTATLGFLLAGSEGKYFPYVNLLGVLMFVAVMEFTRRMN